jgi:hypothetical protein
VRQSPRPSVPSVPNRRRSSAARRSCSTTPPHAGQEPGGLPRR